jgi:cobalt-zinc-cadmium efflux system membrane fusion protein
MVALLTVSCTDSSHDHDHDHDHEHSHGNSHDGDTGRHGGRVIVQGPWTFEVKIQEGISPRFKVWLSGSSGPVAPSDAQIALVTTRLRGTQERFVFTRDGDGWLATTAVDEPHSFDVSVQARIADERVSVDFESYEGRTVIDSLAAGEAGVITANVTGGAIITTLDAAGVILPAANAQAAVTARFPGVVQNILVQVGDRVRQGQTLATVESNLSMSSYGVTAPITGVITKRLIDVGMLVDKEPLLQIVDPSRITVELSVFGHEIFQVEVGQSVSVAILGGSTRLAGRVTRIKPVLDRVTQSALVQVSLLETLSAVVPGSAVVGEIVLDETVVSTRVPRTALQTFGGKDVVFIRRGDIYEAQPVVIGRQDTEFAEITTGLSGSEQIVVEQSFLIKADIEKSGAVHDH